MSMSKQNRKEIIHSETKIPQAIKPIAQTTQQTQSFNHKASDKRLRAVSNKWWRKRSVWHRFKLGSVSSPLLIRRTCNLKIAGWSLASVSRPSAILLSPVKDSNAIFLRQYILKSKLVSNTSRFYKMTMFLLHLASALGIRSRWAGFSPQWAGWRLFCTVMFPGQHCRSVFKQEQKHFPKD